MRLTTGLGAIAKVSDASSPLTWSIKTISSEALSSNIPVEQEFEEPGMD